VRGRRGEGERGRERQALNEKRGNGKQKVTIYNTQITNNIQKEKRTASKK
jgi:hypothetical protein